MNAIIADKPPKRWLDYMANDKSFAETAIIKQQRLLPMLIVHGDEGGVVIPLTYVTDAEKDEVFRVAELVIHTHRAIAISVLLENWFVDHPTEEEKSGVRRVSDSDQRQEGVSIQLFYRVLEKKYAISSLRRIIRKDGNVIGLSDEVFALPPGGSISGRFANLFPARPISVAQQRQAKRALDAITATKH